MTEKNSHCRHCGFETVFRLHRQKFVNGSEHFVWVCKKCERLNPSKDGGMYIPNAKIHSTLTPDQIASLPVLMPDAFSRCVVCGSRDCELHHWAPKFLFGPDVANKWPKDYLCKSCHDLWHETVTPKIKGE